MQKTKSIQINAILNIIKQCCVIVFPLITFPYVSRVLGSANLGRYSFSDSIIQYFISFASLGIPTYAVREAARVRSNKKELTQLATELFSINVVMMIVSYIILFVVVFFVPRVHRESVLMIILSFNILFNTLGRDWINTVFEDFFYLTLRYIILQTISLILILCLVKRPEHYILYTIIMALAYSGNYLLNIFYTRRYIPYRFTTKLNLKKHLKPILYLFCITISTTMYVKSDITILGFFRSDSEVGIYTLSSNIYTVIKSLLNAVIIVVIPRLSVYLGENKSDEYEGLLNSLKKVLYTMIIPAIVGIFLLIKDVMLFMGGEAYVSGYVSLRILCFSLFFAVFGCYYSQGVLVSLRKEKYYFIATFTSAVANVILNLILVPFFGLNATAATTVIAEAMVMLICRHYSLSSLQHKEKVDLITIGLGCIGIIVACYLCNRLITGLILRIIISIVVSVIAYFTILILLGNEVAKEFVVSAKKRILKR